MSTTPLLRSLLLALCTALAAACSGSNSDIGADDYNGAIDGTGLDAKFLPTSRKYPIQLGYGNGKSFSFYEIGAVRTSNLPNPLPASLADHKTDGSGGSHVDNFPNGCRSDSAFNPRLDAFPRLKQGPIFDSLPLAVTSTALVPPTPWPFVALYGVDGAQGSVCNDLKDTRSIANPGDAAPGHFGARRTARPTSYQLWAVIDPTATVAPIAATPQFGAQLGWYKGLQLSFLNGGGIPTQLIQDPASPTDPTRQISTLVAMEGVILDPAGSSTFEKTTTDKAIVVPALPGEDAWSPIVRLHDFRMPAGKKLGDYTGICAAGAPRPCPAGTVDITAAGAAFNTVFLVSAPQ